MTITVGEILVEDFLKPVKMTPEMLAEKSGIAIDEINGIIDGKNSITPEIASKLAEVFGTSTEMWINLQVELELSAIP